MVKLIVGGTGTGKTKTIIELVNAAVKEEKGSVVCIAKGDKLKFDISYDARLVNISDYMVEGYKGLLGFVSGIHAGNYDITKIYIDSLYKLLDSGSGCCRSFPQGNRRILKQACRGLYGCAQRG